MKMFTNKGQAALEFMMTYGWAILVVLAAIGALSYFGILNPAKFTPDTCLASSGFACPGKPIVNDTTIIFSIVNSQGFKVNLNAANVVPSTTLVSACTGPPYTVYMCPQGNVTCANTTAIVEDGSGVTIRLENCPTLINSNVIKGELRMSYVNPQSKLSESLIVSITGKTKAG